MLKMKKNSLLLILFFLCTTLHAQIINDAQVIQSGHWIYDAMTRLQMEDGTVQFTATEPESAVELLFYLEQIDEESLSVSGKELYEKARTFLTTKESFYSDEAFSAGFTGFINPELCYKSNPEIDWTYNYNFRDNFLTLTPVYVGFGNSVAFQLDVFAGKQYFAAREPDNFTNIPLAFNDIRTYYPTFCYGGFAKHFNGWGLSFHTGKQGRTIGHTKTGSIIYNDTFESDMYATMSLWSRRFKAVFDVVQMSWNQFLYFHAVEAKPLNNLRLRVSEGSLLHGSFQIKSLHPINIMHSYAASNDNKSDMESHYYNVANYGSYLGIDFEWIPWKNTRLYGLCSITEMQLSNELVGKFASIPNGIGAQFGADQIVPLREGQITGNVEAVYTSPFQYINQTPGDSFCRLRYYNEMPDLNTSEPVATWLGTPYGPDCFAISTSVGYDNIKNWSVELSYLFKIHGDNTAEMLWYNPSEQIEYNKNTVTVYNYYPFTKYVIASDIGDEEGMNAAMKEGREMWMSGIPEYTNQISVNAAYNVNERISLAGKFTYSYVINSRNTSDVIEHGFEAAASCRIKLF